MVHLTAFLLLLCGCTDLLVVLAMEESQVLVSPQSILIPVGAEALFTCKFRNVQRPYWKVNETEANISVNKRYLATLGIFIEDDITLTLRANGSYPTVNNTRIICKTHSSIESNSATILTIAESPLPFNPFLEQPNATSLVLKWSPPFLWPGNFIQSYNVSVRNHGDGNINFSQVNSTSFSDAIESFTFIPHGYRQRCTNFTFGITPMYSPLTNEAHYVTGIYLSALGNFDVSAIALFRADGTPLVRVVVKPSHDICSYQELDITISVTVRATNALVTKDGPIPHRGNISFEYDITSSNLKREVEYLMSVTVSTGFQHSTNTFPFNTSLDPDLYPTNQPCIHVAGKSGKLQKSHEFTYKVAMGACLGLAALMLLTLVFVLLCFLIHRQRRISQGKALNISTYRMQNAMVHNPIYDGPVYESVQPHFDTLTATVKQDLSLSNTSSGNSPPRSSSPPNTGSENSSQKMVRYLDQPIQPRSLSLSHPSTPDNSNPTSGCSMCAQATRVMGLKKNGKERNKLHLTLTLDGKESANPVPCRKEEEVILAGDLPGDKRAVASDADENYTVMSPIKGNVGCNIGGMIMTELSPEDTGKYKEEVN